jgi:5-methylcytosine-specific restriction endonuclease McrA
MAAEIPREQTEELLAALPPASQTARSQREVPTFSELQEAVSTLPVDQARQIIARARPRSAAPPEANGEPPPVTYTSWENYLARTTLAERRRWCAAKAAKANSFRLMSGRPETTISADDVLAVLERARGQCAYCESLAVERLPRGPWGYIGRRIGSLGHKVARFNGGPNTPANLAWCCMWCNTWPEERIKGATDHGGYFPG